MVGSFVGRHDELAALDRHLAAARTGQGQLVAVRGRRQAGKSRLVTEFVKRAVVPSLFYTASRQASLAEDLDRFVADVGRDSDLPDRELVSGGAFAAWEPALRALAATLPPGRPSVVVLDELPWLLQRDPGLEGTLQKLWDRVLEPLPVLLILIGSDVAMMERLSEHDRPLFGRTSELVVRPFHLRDTARMLGLEQQPAAAVDAQLIAGGYPRLLQEWQRSGDQGAFLEASFTDENSSLAVLGQRVLDAEFPADVGARAVLGAIGGAGERTFTAIGGLAGQNATSLSRSLILLRDVKGVVAQDTPLSTAASREHRYRVADSYLRFWLRFCEPGMADVARGRPDLALRTLRDGWASWRGRAVEPLVREALLRRAADDPRLHGASVVGGWWPRSNNPEVDLVGADARPARRIAFVGSGRRAAGAGCARGARGRGRAAGRGVPQRVHRHGSALPGSC